MGTNDRVWIGTAVPEASNLSGIGRRRTIKSAIVMSEQFYHAVSGCFNKKNKPEEHSICNRIVYSCDDTMPKFDNWLNNNLRL